MCCTEIRKCAFICCVLIITRRFAVPFLLTKRVLIFRKRGLNLLFFVCFKIFNQLPQYFIRLAANKKMKNGTWKLISYYCLQLKNWRNNSLRLKVLWIDLKKLLWFPSGSSPRLVTFQRLSLATSSVWKGTTVLAIETQLPADVNHMETRKDFVK